MLEQSIINALKKGGKYTFTILVRTEYEGPIMPPNFTPKSATNVFRKDIVELEVNQILDRDVQKELEGYFKKNHLHAIELNGQVIWKETTKIKIFMSNNPDNFTVY